MLAHLSRDAQYERAAEGQACMKQLLPHYQGDLPGLSKKTPTSGGRPPAQGSDLGLLRVSSVYSFPKPSSSSPQNWGAL